MWSGHGTMPSNIAARLLQFLQARINFLREQVDALDGFAVVEKARLPHHQQMTETAVVIVQRLDLFEDRVGISRKYYSAGDQALEIRLFVLVERTAVAQRLRRRFDRNVSGRIDKLRRDAIRFEIPHQLARAGETFLVGLTGVDQGGVGETIVGSFPSGLARALAIGIEDRFRAVEARQKRAGDVTVVGDRRNAAGAERGNPYGRMRLLVRARPDVDLAM